MIRGTGSPWTTIAWLAAELGVSLEQVVELPVREILGWLARRRGS